MAYLSPEYDHDIFISYSQGDFDKKGASDLLDWSKEFVKRLRSELRQDPKFREISVFVDIDEEEGKGLDRTLGLTKQLREKLERTALLAILMSPHYLQSAWCREERASWIRHHAPEGNHGGRIFAVRIWPVDDKEWPRELCEDASVPPLGFYFHSREAHGSAPRPLGWSRRLDDNDAYIEELLRLVGAVLSRLREVKTDLDHHRKAQQEAQRLGADKGQVLYLYARERDRALWTEVN